MDTTKPNLTLEYALLALLALLWGSSYLFIKVAVAEIPPLTLIAIRVSIAAMFLLAVMRWQGLKFPRDVKTWRVLLIQSFFNSIGAWTLLAWGQQYVDSGLASVLNSTSPVFIFFITLFFTRHEPVNLLKLGGALLGLAGVALIVGVGALQGLGSQITGQIAALGGALLYAFAAIYGKNLAHVPAAVTSAGTMLWAMVFLIPMAFVFESPQAIAPSTSAIIATVILSVFCTGIALLIYFRLLKTLGSLGTASQAYLRAGVGVILGVVFLGEILTLGVTIGILLALLGVIAINAPARRKA